MISWETKYTDDFKRDHVFFLLYTCRAYYPKHSEIPLIFVTRRDCRVYINLNYTRKYRDDDDDDDAKRDCVSTIEQKEVGMKTGIVLNTNVGNQL